MVITDILYLSATIFTCAAIFGWVNVLWFRLPHAIAMVLFALILSLGMILLDAVTGGSIAGVLGTHVAKIQFDETLMIGMLSFLLFAGSLHVDLGILLLRKWPVILMATAGVLISTFVVGVTAYYLLALVHIAVPLTWCLVFGALISPTDPIAVMDILKRVKLPPALGTAIAGESLFNDGMGVVVFTVMISIALASPDMPIQSSDIALLFAQEVLGGLFAGLAAGYLAFLAMRKIDDYNIEVLITIALVTALYSLCLLTHTSGPLAVVVAGLVIGNHGKRYAMSQKTSLQVQTFWALLDEILNSILFLLIGFEILVLVIRVEMLMVTVLIIPVVLLARFISVAASLKLLPLKQGLGRGAIPILTWSGLRGGISIALALSLPPFEGRDVITVMTYGVVICSIVLQGLTIERLANRYREK